MLSSRTICVSCRTRLASRLGLSRSPSPATTTTTSPTSRLSPTRRHAATSSETPSLAKPHGKESSSGAARPSSAKRRALDLFESTVSANTANLGAPNLTAQPPTTSTTTTTELEPETTTTPLDTQELMRQAVKIDKIMKEQAHQQRKAKPLLPIPEAARCFAIVEREIVPALQQANGQKLPQVVYSTVARVMRRVLDAKFDPSHREWLAHGDMPSAAALCRVVAELGMRSPGRLDPVFGLVQWLVPRLPTSESESGAESPGKSSRDLETGLDDLVTCWADLSRSRSSTASRGEGEDSSLSPSHRQKLPRRAPVEKLGRLPNEFPYLVENNADLLAAVLVTTYLMLSEPAAQAVVAGRALEAEVEELGRIVKTIDHGRLGMSFREHPDLWKYVSPRINWTGDALTSSTSPDKLRSATPTSPSARPPLRPSPGKRVSYEAWHRRLQALFKTNNTDGLRAAWQQLTEPTDDPDRATKLRQCPELFGYILHSCCSRHRGPDRDFFIQLNEMVLEYMQRIGLRPTVRTYTAMIEGWKAARMLHQIERVWQQLVRTSDVTLDEHIWTSRISACGQLGKQNQGLKALEEMYSTWRSAQAAAAGTSPSPAPGAAPPSAVKPGIASVNAAISGLLRKDNLKDVRTVLAWAADKGIEPDIYTYNQMLRYMLRKGLMNEVDKILSSMRALGVNPDGATFTIILDIALAEMPSQTPDAQRATVARVFSEMAACGIVPNQETYAKMLHVLTRSDVATASTTTTTTTANTGGQNHNDNNGRTPPSAPLEAVLAHLRGSGQQPSPEICTILFEYYYSRSPPDWAAVRALIADRRSRTRALADRVFWQTVMRRLHDAGDMAGALDIFYDMDEWGIWPALSVLEPLLRDLTARRDWEHAQSLVDTVRRQERPASEDPKGRFWKQAFWAVAREYGLGGEKGGG